MALHVWAKWETQIWIAAESIERDILFPADRSRRVPKHMLPLAHFNAVHLLHGATAPDRVAVSQIARCRFCT